MLLLCSAVASALLVVLLLLYLYNPSGRYEGKNVLLSPQLVEQISFEDLNGKTGASSRFVFDNMELVFYDIAAQRWQSYPISLEKYATFFNAVQSDLSLADPDKKVENIFASQKVASLHIVAKTVSDEKWQKITKVIQEVEFAAADDLYRVDLRQEALGGKGWAYFHRQNISELLTALTAQASP